MSRNPKMRVAKPRVALVGDGETEQIYFANVKDTDRPADLDLFPTLPKKKGTYRHVLDRAAELVPDYDRVFALIDMDTVISDGHVEAYGRAKQIALDAGIVVLENNPCFEIWLLLHFVNTSRSFTRCGEVEYELQQPKRIPGYKKSKDFLIRAGLYKTHRTLIPTDAIPNAKRLEVERPIGNDRYPRAGTYLFFDWYVSPDRLKQLKKNK